MITTSPLRAFLLAQHLALRQLLDFFRRYSQQYAEYGFVIFTRGMSKVVTGNLSLRQSNGGPDTRGPTHLGVVDIAREAALSEMRIAVQILRRLDDSRCDALVLEHHHDLMRRVLGRPRLNPRIKLFVVCHP